MVHQAKCSKPSFFAVMFLCIGTQSQQADRLEFWHGEKLAPCNGTFSLSRMQTSLLVC